MNTVEALSAKPSLSQKVHPIPAKSLFLRGLGEDGGTNL